MVQETLTDSNSSKRNNTDERLRRLTSWLVVIGFALFSCFAIWLVAFAGIPRQLYDIFVDHFQAVM